MSTIRRFLPVLVLIAAGAVLTFPVAADTSQADTIIALERGALDRWGAGDPQGYLELYSRDVTYFDPTRERRVDGIAAMRQLLEPLAGRIKVDRYEMIGPQVQRAGDAAILTYNLASHARRPDGKAVVIRWNSTAVYGRVDGRWRILHSHWSYTKPDVTVPSFP